ncbi:MAG TPA: RNA polymerase sigma-70 factor [Bacteroidales bacterium]|nr:RNA polymerase sigma-70 factor [Bacteroidales bacterium]
MTLNLSDNEILTRIKKGDEKAFEALYKGFFSMLCMFSYRYVKKTEIAEEIVQDVFYHIWEKRSQFELTTSFKSYLYKSVHNNSLKHLRHQKIVLAYENSTAFSGSEKVTGQNILEETEVFQILHDVIDDLPERTRDIFQLNRFKGLKYQEIAEYMQISVKTVEAHMSSVLKILRTRLKDYGSFIITGIILNLL